MNMFNALMVSIVLAGITTALFIGIALVCVDYERAEFQEDFSLGSVVTTTAEYEYLTNDSFTGVVVRGETWDDPALTIRNRDGVERRIATHFLEPMR